METPAQSDPSGFETLEAFSTAAAINRWVYEKISRYAQGQVLEIGSGIGNISALLLRDRSTVSLSDLRPEYCGLHEKKLRQDPHLQGVYELDLQWKDFKTKNAGLWAKFDTVTTPNVIENF